MDEASAREAADWLATCIKCDKLHEFRPSDPSRPKGLHTWADPVDQHSYYPRGPGGVVKVLLEEAERLHQLTLARVSATASHLTAATGEAPEVSSWGVGSLSDT